MNKHIGVIFLLLLAVCNNAYGGDNRTSAMGMIDSTEILRDSMEPSLHAIYNFEEVNTSRGNKFKLDLKWRPRKTWIFDSSELTIGGLKSRRTGIIFWNWRFGKK